MTVCSARVAQQLFMHLGSATLTVYRKVMWSSCTKMARGSSPSAKVLAKLKSASIGYLEECHFQRLMDFTILDKPISAAEIKKAVQKNVVFLRTMSPMPDGQLLLNLIQKRSA